MAGDLTGDGVDDLVVCNKVGAPLLVQQSLNGTFSRVEIPPTDVTTQWRSVRIADVTGDGRPDVTVTFWNGSPSKIAIFRGIETSPYFDFADIFAKHCLPHAATDLAVFDVKLDGIPDVYVVQTNESKEEYCGPSPIGVHVWGISKDPPSNWTPPLDYALDFLLVRSNDNIHQPFELVTMNHTQP